MAKKNQNSKETTSAPLRHENHAKPRTRRDFMAMGLLGPCAYVATPSLVSLLLESRAFGAECAVTDQSAGLPPAFFSIDLIGGGNIAGSNVMVGGPGGQEDPLSAQAYSRLGLPGNMIGQYNKEMGLVFHQDSAFLRGIKSVAQPATLANVEGAVFCVPSDDDTSKNPHNPLFWINRAGTTGQLTSLIRTDGLNSQFPPTSIVQSAFPVMVNDSAAAQNLVSVGRINEILGKEKGAKVLAAIQNLSEAQLQKFNEKGLSGQVRDLVKCGYIQSIDAMHFDPNKLNPANDPVVTGIFGQQLAGLNQKVATVGKLAIDGYAGAASIAVGGYDYHTGNRAAGEAKDEEAGRIIGQLLEMAARKKRDVMIYVFSDGSLSSKGGVDNSPGGRGKLNWNDENGESAATFMLVYKKDGKPSVRNGKRQIGHFNSSGAANRGANAISNQNIVGLTQAVAANYLALQGREVDFAKVVGEDSLGGNPDPFIIFEKLR